MAGRRAASRTEPWNKPTSRRFANLCLDRPHDLSGLLEIQRCSDAGPCHFEYRSVAACAAPVRVAAARAAHFDKVVTGAVPSNE
jgi:hypothetical protein